MSVHEKFEIDRRPEYTLENLDRVFTVLRAFGIKTTPQQQYIYDQLFCGIDFADQIIDIQEPNSDIVNHILSYLTGNCDSLPLETPQNVIDNFSFLQENIKEKGIGPRVEETTLGLLTLHNKLSKTDSIADYIRFTKQEAIESAKLAFLFGPDDLTQQVKSYLTQANILGNLADNLLDLDSDYSEGKILITPTLELKRTLKFQIAKQLAILSWHSPQKKELAKLAMKYIKMLGKDA